jgi:RNA polymerase sigma factor (sigma-70 family)
MSPPHHVSPSLPALPCALPVDEDRWFREEVQLHEPMLRAYLRRKFPRLTDVDDLVQESYIRLLRARVAGTLHSAKGFLFTAARNAAFDLFRRHAVISFEPLTEETTSSVYSDTANAAEAASLNQELDILTAAMRDLPDRCRQILLLRRIHGLSHKAIAEKLSISEHTVEKQVGIGLRKCVAFMQSRGVVITKKP